MTIYVDTLTFLLSFNEITFVSVTARVFDYALPMKIIIFKLAFVYARIRGFVDALALFLISDSLTLICLSIWPCHDSLAFSFVSIE